MPNAVMEKLEHIEKLILQLNARIDNFLGYENLTPDEKVELKKIRGEVRAGEYSLLDASLSLIPEKGHINYEWGLPLPKNALAGA